METGHAGHEKSPNEGRTEGPNHEKSNHGEYQSEKLVTNFVRNGVPEGAVCVLPRKFKGLINIEKRRTHYGS